mgnify:CR=1 FL=1
MPTWIIPVYRIPTTVAIGVRATRSKWADTVRLVESHQARAKPPVSIPQQITPRCSVFALPLETQKWRNGAVNVMAVSGIVHPRYVITHTHQHRLL